MTEKTKQRNVLVVVHQNYVIKRQIKLRLLEEQKKYQPPDVFFSQDESYSSPLNTEGSLLPAPSELGIISIVGCFAESCILEQIFWLLNNGYQNNEINPIKDAIM